LSRDTGRIDKRSNKLIQKGPKMKTAIALSAILATTPAMACTDWKAIAAFDAIIESGDVTMRAEMMKDANLAHSDSDRKLVAEMQDILTKHAADLISDKAAALHDTCQENTR
jgi:hypothetical protein